MHAYLATICRDLGGEIVHVGGVADHAHIITTLPRTASQAQFIEQIKKVSSKWIKMLDVRYRGFFWSTLITNKGTIEVAHSKRNIVSCCASMASISTNATFGIEHRMNRAFSACLTVARNSRGDAPA
jgi:REP element-mobilizing transposase RayT